jgi:hypothetical protein
MENPDKKVFNFGLSHLTGNQKTYFNRFNDVSDPLQCYCDPVITQQATFYHKTAVEQFGAASIHLHYCMDYEWWLKLMFLYGNTAIYSSSEPIAVFRMHTDSKTSQDHTKFVNDIANILHSVCEQLGLTECQELLKKGFTISPVYNFDVKVPLQQRELVKRMVIYFFLKWSRFITTKKQFYLAIEIESRIKQVNIELTEKEKKWFAELIKTVHFKNWTLFRIKRKINWFSNH